MKVYVNCITSGAELRSDIKVLIPEMNLRRRMSRVVKSGVAAGIESLLEFGARAPIDAIITATGLGCIADSEKFLDSLIANEERMLNPTPFIQSSFFSSKMECFFVMRSSEKVRQSSAGGMMVVSPSSDQPSSAR